jgi:hypothetical protein
MGMLRICAADGCETKTLGAFCIEHESLPWHAGEQPVARSLRAVVEVTRVEPREFRHERIWAVSA